MRPGQMRDSVKFQTQSVTKDETGHKVNTWADTATRPALIEDMTGRNFFAALGQNTSVSTRITVRYDSAVAAFGPQNQIVDARTGTVYQIIAGPLDPKHTKKELVFMCEIKGRF